MKNKYRVINDGYAGFEVQVKFWWFPIMWYQCGINTHKTLDEAKQFAEFKAKHHSRTKRKVYSVYEADS